MGQPVSNQRLLSAFWGDERVTNPENALKTLISRVRAMLSQISPDLGGCIVADRGAYHWECLPEMTIDLYELEDVFSRLQDTCDAERKRALYRRMMQLYRGPLLQKSELNEWVFPRATALHNQYIAGIYGYIEMLKQSEKAEDEQEIISVCRGALEREPFDDRIHIELMRALLKNNNATEAKAQFEEVMHLHYHYLNVKPSRELMEFYNEIVEASKNIEFNLETICRQLYQSSREQGAFVCDFPVFKEIFNLQIRNIERLDSTMFLAVIMVSKINGEQMGSIKQENVMHGLMEILRTNLAQGRCHHAFLPDDGRHAAADRGLQHGRQRDGTAQTEVLSGVSEFQRAVQLPHCAFDRADGWRGTAEGPARPEKTDENDPNNEKERRVNPHEQRDYRAGEEPDCGAFLLSGGEGRGQRVALRRRHGRRKGEGEGACRRAWKKTSCPSTG